MKKQNSPIEKLKGVIEETCTHIQDFTKAPTDFIRNRKLNAKTTLEVTLNMQGNSLNAELLNAFPNMDERMTASAYEQAKGKLKPSVFEYIFKEFNKAMPVQKLLDNKYRVYAIDGTDFTTPYNPNSERVFPTSNLEKPVCITHANILFDLENKTYQDMIIQPRMEMDERGAAIDIVRRMDTSVPNIVIMDRGYEGFNVIESLNRVENCFYIIRGRTATAGGIKEITSLPDKECDEDIEIVATTSQVFYNQNKGKIKNLHRIKHNNKHYKDNLAKSSVSKRWDHEQICTIRFRVVKFQINEDGKNMWEVLITNLDREEFPIEHMKEMYHKRWGIETSFRSLKYALGGINFHSKKDEFIDMEIYSHLIMFNVVSHCVNQVTVIHQKDYAIDFKMACHLVRQYFHRKNVKPFEQLLREIANYINPIRLGRSDQRKVKSRSPVWFVYRVA